MICGIIVVLLLGWYASYIFIFYSSFQKNTWGFVPEWEQASNLAKHRGLGQLRIAGTQGGRMEDEGNAWEAASFTWGGGGGKKYEESEHFRKTLHKDFKYREKELVPSRELTYPTLGKENHLQIYLGWGYVSFLEGILPMILFLGYRTLQVQRIPLTDSGSPLASPMLLRQATERGGFSSAVGWTFGKLRYEP